jgi:small nuclear ribonucleoprotein (snRNP)-like protein
MAEQRASYEPLITGNAQSADPTSPISYVRGILGRKVRILLTDGHRIFEGIFSALDYTGTLAFRDVSELTENHQAQVGVCVISINDIQLMELID